MKRFILCWLGGSLLLSACVTSHVAGPEKLRIVTTFYPLTYIMQRIGGNDIDVMQIVPAGIEPHEYEPTPHDVAMIEYAHALLLNGNGIDAWAEKFMTQFIQEEKQVIRAVDCCNDLSKRLPEETIDPNDPHTWLDPVLMSAMAIHIRGALRSSAYISAQEHLVMDKRLELLTQDLTILDEEYKKQLSRCALHDIVTAHDAFGYAGKRYGFTVHSIAGLSPEEEPSPKQMADLTDLIKKLGIDTVFFESLTSPKLAETIAQETGVKTAVLNPIEGLTNEDRLAGKDYLSLMRDNLAALRGALHCP